MSNINKLILILWITFVSVWVQSVISALPENVLAKHNKRQNDNVPCTCGVFLSGQFTRGSSAPPKGNPVLLYEYNSILACNANGNKQCTNKCLETIVKHLPNSGSLVCGSIDRNCHKERAYLFIQNCDNKWINTGLSAGREYCCRDGVQYKCTK